MDPDRFHPLLTAHGPFASVYFDDSHDTQDARAQIELKWRALREQLEQQGAEQAIIERIEQAIGESAPAVGRSGRAVVATAGGIVTSDAIDAEGYPVHKASSAESSGYGDPQRTAEGARLKNIREVADRLTSLVDDVDPAVVFVVGEVQSRSDFAKDLPDRVAARAVHLSVGARHSGFDDEQLRHEIDQEFQRRRLATIDEAAQQFRTGVGSGSRLATEGLDGVTAALRAGAVETLIIGEIGDATVVAGDDLATVAPNEKVLSELGTAPKQVLRADEALPMLAVATGASLVRTDERIAPTDGVAAVLRYSLR